MTSPNYFDGQSDEMLQARWDALATRLATASFMAAGIYAAQANMISAELERRASAPLTRTERFTGPYSDAWVA